MSEIWHDDSHDPIGRPAETYFVVRTIGFRSKSAEARTSWQNIYEVHPVRILTIPFPSSSSSTAAPPNMQAPNISNTEPLPFGMHHRLRSSRSNLLCPGVVYLDDTTTASVAFEKELDGKLSRPWAKIANDDREHHFFDARLNSADCEEDTDDTSSCCSEESSIDE